MQDHSAALSQARHLLETQGLSSGTALSPDISDSWRRSLSAGLDPLARDRRMILNATELQATRQQNADLLRFARPELEMLFDQITGSSYMIALGSAGGVVLDTLCDAPFAETMAATQVVPGALWTEDLRGTNAMGLCIATRRPAQVYGGEHFMRAHSAVSCVSAPIFDGLGGLAGVLDASSLSILRHQHMAAMVQMSAFSIENSLIRSRDEDHLILQFHPRPEYLGTVSMGLLVLAADGKIKALNSRGEMLLNGFVPLRGAAFDQIFTQSIDDLQRQLVAGETLRIRDRSGAALSIRCVANRASFGLARRMTSLAAPEVVPDRRNLFRDVVLDDATLRRRLSALPEAAKRGTPIRITGETGTGKEIVARLCHAASGRTGPFVVLDGNSSAAADFDALCFGTPDGRPGVFEQASGGTLFLNELTGIPAAVQAGLVRALDMGEFRQPGTGRVIKADLRLVSAVTLPIAVSEALPLIAALRYRLDGFRIDLPPLRARSDLATLAQRFARSMRDDATLDASALARLAGYHWPGNLHELRAIVTQAVLQSKRRKISAEDLHGLLPEPAALPVDPAGGYCAGCAGVPWKEQHCQAIRAAVAEYTGNVSRAARNLGMSRTTIYKHLQG